MDDGQIHLSIVFGAKKQKCLTTYKTENYALESKSVKLLLRNCDPNMTQNEHVYAICSRLEVGGDVISGENVKNVEGSAVLNFEVGSSNSFRDIPKNHFMTAAADIDDSIKRKRLRRFALK